MKKRREEIAHETGENEPTARKKRTQGFLVSCAPLLTAGWAKQELRNISYSPGASLYDSPEITDPGGQGK